MQVRQETGAQCLPQRPHGHQPTEPACPLPLPPREWPVGGGNPASPPHAPCTLPGPPLPRVWAVEQSQPPGRREEGVQATTSLPSAAPRSPKGAIPMCLHLSSATSSRDIHQPPIRGRYLCQALGDHHSGETPPEAGRRPCVLSSTGRGRSGACRVQVWFATTLSWLALETTVATVRFVSSLVPAGRLAVASDAGTGGRGHSARGRPACRAGKVLGTEISAEVLKGQRPARRRLPAPQSGEAASPAASWAWAARVAESVRSLSLDPQCCRGRGGWSLRAFPSILKPAGFLPFA